MGGKNLVYGEWDWSAYQDITGVVKTGLCMNGIYCRSLVLKIVILDILLAVFYFSFHIH